MGENPNQFSIRALLLTTAFIACAIGVVRIAGWDAIGIFLIVAFLVVAAAAVFVVAIDNKWFSTVIVVCICLLGLAVFFGACGPVIH
jgi:hypothetical protein